MFRVFFCSASSEIKISLHLFSLESLLFFSMLTWRVLNLHFTADVLFLLSHSWSIALFRDEIILHESTTPCLVLHWLSEYVILKNQTRCLKPKRKGRLRNTTKEARFLCVVHYSALPNERASVDKQTGPQRVHKSRHILYI